MDNDFFASAVSLRDPCFTHIFAFSFYDGPELGLAVFESGAVVRFSVLGESRSRLFRAFKLDVLAGDWRTWVRDGRYEPTRHSGAPIIIETAVDGDLQLEKDILAAASIKQYVAVGTPYLDKLSAVEVSREESEIIKNLVGAQVFSTVHNKIKSSRRNSA